MSEHYESGTPREPDTPQPAGWGRTVFPAKDLPRMLHLGKTALPPLVAPPTLPTSTRSVPSCGV